MKTLSRMAALACGVAVLAAACDQGATSPQTSDPSEVAPRASHGTTEQADVEEFEVCKYGTAATFDFTVDDLDPADNDFSGSFTLNPGECHVVTESGGVGDFVTVTEQADPAIQLDDIVVTTVGSNTNVSSSVATRTVSGTVSGAPGGAGGILAQFFNSVVPTGGEGCTPGYWKQEHHFDSWVTYNPGDDFDTVFGVDLFSPDITLLQALELKGGQENALARHAVAALLNATSSVDYDLTEAQVIAAVQAAVSSGDFEATKDMFEGFNEQGCPLN